MTKKQWTYLFVGIVALIVIIILYAYRDKFIAKDANQGDSNIITMITGSTCTGLSKDMIKSLQQNLNDSKCVDLAGNSLTIDGVIGKHTFEAIQNCVSKKIIG